MSTIPDFTTPSPRADSMRQMLPQIRAIVESLDGFAFMTTGERLRINTSANVPDRFLEAVAVAIEVSDMLASNTKLTPAQLREMIVFTQAGSVLADELERLARGVRDTVRLKRAEVATEALRAFGVARTINRPGDREELISTVDQMQRALGRGRRKATAAKPPDPPA